VRRTEKIAKLFSISSFLLLITGRMLWACCQPVGRYISQPSLLVCLSIPAKASASAAASPPPSACSQPLLHRHSCTRPASRFLPERLNPSEQVAAAGGGQGSREPTLQSGARRRRRGLTGSGRGIQGHASGGRQRAAAPAPAQQRLARRESEFPSFCKFKQRHSVCPQIT